MPNDQQLGALLAVKSTRKASQTAAAPQPRWAWAAMLALPLIAIAVRLFFWFYTQRTWEDALITVQHAENAVRGLGLNHDPIGPPVHGFTSALSVLVPLLGEVIHRGFGLPLLRLVSAICGGISVWLGMRICQRLGLSFPVTLLAGGYLAIEHQQILFGMAGMETQIAVTVVLLSIDSLFDMQPWLIGISLGLCALARPDFAPWVVLVLALVAWRCWKEANWRPVGTILFALLLICGPWIAFTTWYYGGPLPHTILAKAWGFGDHWYAGLSALGIASKLWSRLLYIFAILGPAYGGNGTGYAYFSFDPRGAISCVILLFAVIGAISALRSKSLPAIAMAGFFLAYSAYYLFLVGVIALWYCIPLAAVTVLTAAIGVNAILSILFAGRSRAIAGYALAAAYLATLVAVMPATFTGERNLQRFVEDGVRKQVGLYIAGATRPDQTVGCEPLGYIGYYSRRVMFAYPGMCNRDVVRFVHQHPQRRNLIDMLDYFRPDYIALRPLEYRVALRRGNTWIVSDYERVADFRVPDEQRAQLLFPEGNLDTEFYVFKRISAIPPQRP